MKKNSNSYGYGYDYDEYSRDYGYGYYGSSDNQDAQHQSERNIKMCGAMNFAASEAYKLLRTNLLFTVPDEGKCRVVGVTSASRGEAKSTTSVNLAYTIAEAGKRVLLIDCDLRLPSIARKLSIDKVPGLSNYLVGKNEAKDVIKQTNVHANLYILPAGDIPPNPSELLGSNRMKETIEAFKMRFDFIIIDLPPVNIVSDALAISKFLNGVIVAVRNNYSLQREVMQAVEQLKFANANILGFVYTALEDGKHGYGYKKYNYYHSKYSKYRKSGKYTKGYYEGYKKGYEIAYGTRPTIDFNGMPVYEDIEKEEANKEDLNI